MQVVNLKNKRGKFIVLYGPNNIGKSIQTRELVSRIVLDGNQVIMIKYPIYHLEETGPKIDKILRGKDSTKKKVSEEEFQKLYAQNRRDFQPNIINLLNSNIHVIAEDYTGTGISWGMTRGVKVEILEQINKGLIEPDLSLTLDGKRFSESIESGHRNESDGDKVWKKNREIHLFLAKRYSWTVINANRIIKEVHEEIWDNVKPILESRDPMQLKLID